jgi:hypothetical protein
LGAGNCSFSIALMALSNQLHNFSQNFILLIISDKSSFLAFHISIKRFISIIGFQGFVISILSLYISIIGQGQEIDKSWCIIALATNSRMAMLG